MELSALNLIKKWIPAPAQRSLRLIRFNISNFLFRPYVIEREVFCNRQKIYISDKVALKWYGINIRLHPSFKFLIDHKDRYKSVLYLGAHHAVHPIGLLRLLAPETKMVAVEANPHHYTVATRNVSINNASIDLIHAAVAAEDGTIGFSIDNRVFSGDRRQPSIDVPALSINRLVEDHGIPSLIIMDIEGYEWVALSGASRALQSPSTDWCIEVHINAGLEEFAGSLESILTLFPRAAYDLWMARDFGNSVAVPLDLQSQITKKRFHLLALHR